MFQEAFLIHEPAPSLLVEDLLPASSATSLPFLVRRNILQDFWCM
jgi:hypothetical protein